jgi:hypothetical protein
VIGAVFAVIVMYLGLNVLTSGLNFQTQYGQVITELSTADTQQGKEVIELRDGKIDNDKFNMTVVNTGSLPTKLVRMWVTNTTATTGWHKNYTLNDVINPGDSLAKLGQNLTLVARNSSSYTLNVITERGSSASFKLVSPSDHALKLSLYAAPLSIPTGQNVTMLFGVSNNITDGSIVQSIKPQISWTPTEFPGSPTPANATLIQSPIPTSEPSLTLAETVFFKYVYKITGDPKDKITFTATIQNAKLGNSITEAVELLPTVNSQMLTLDYASFRWTQGSQWNTGWTIAEGTLLNPKETALKVDFTNNNSTSALWLSKNTMITLEAWLTTLNIAFYITNETIPGGAEPSISYPYTCPSPSPNDYCLKVAPNQKVTLYLAASAPQGNTVSGLGDLLLQEKFSTNLQIYGKYCGSTESKDCTGTPYAQNIPLVVLST